MAKTKPPILEDKLKRKTELLKVAQVKAEKAKAAAKKVRGTLTLSPEDITVTTVPLHSPASALGALSLLRWGATLNDADPRDPWIDADPTDSWFDTDPTDRVHDFTDSGSDALSIIAP